MERFESPLDDALIKTPLLLASFSLRFWIPTVAARLLSLSLSLDLDRVHRNLACKSRLLSMAAVAPAADRILPWGFGLLSLFLRHPFVFLSCDAFECVLGRIWLLVLRVLGSVCAWSVYLRLLLHLFWLLSRI